MCQNGHVGQLFKKKGRHHRIPLEKSSLEITLNIKVNTISLGRRVLRPTKCERNKCLAIWGLFLWCPGGGGVLRQIHGYWGYQNLLLSKQSDRNFVSLNPKYDFFLYIGGGGGSMLNPGVAKYKSSKTSSQFRHMFYKGKNNHQLFIYGP